jgi:methionyl-tRNA formyltransferase
MGGEGPGIDSGLRGGHAAGVAHLKIIFAGSGEFGLPALRRLLCDRHELVQVVSQPDRPAGRGKALTATPVGHFALEQGLPLLRTANINQEQLPPADLLVVIAFGQKIAPNIVDHARLGAVNLHASRLPLYRGAAPINWAILGGESMTGNSIIRLAQKMDAGAILDQSILPIGAVETAGELHDRLAADGAVLLHDVIERLAVGQAAESAQDEARATLAPKLSREATRLDWGRPAVDLARQIRGLYPWPACRVRLLDAGGTEVDRLTLARARPAEAQAHAAAPGTVMDGHIIAGESTAVQLLEVQPEGKRRMTLAAYRNGHPWQSGMRLESI